MQEIEAVAGQFVWLAGTTGPVLSLACLTLFYLVGSFYFPVKVSFPFCLERGELNKGSRRRKDAGF